MDKKKLEEYKSQRAKLITDMRALNSAEMSEEQIASFSKMEADFDSISALISREEKILANEAKFAGQIDGKEFLDKSKGDGGATLDTEQYMEAIGAWMFGGKKPLTDKTRQYCAQAGIDLNANEIEVNLLPTREYKRLIPFVTSYAQSAQQGSKGGYFVPETMVGMIEIARLEHGSVRQVAEVIRTASGNPLTWPTVDDTANEGRLLGENAAVTATDFTVGKQTWNAYKISSDVIKVPFELMEDSAFNVVSLVTDLMGERLASKEEELFTTGTGAGQPQGIVTGAAAGNTTAGATAITLNELHNLAHTVGTYYRRRGSYMMHPSIVKYVMQLTDGTGQFLWQPSVQLGVPDRFRGYPVYENEEMQSTVTTATKTAIFGELAKYKIRDVGTIRISRLNELYAANGQIGFMAHTRVDGGVLNAGGNPIKYMLQA